MKQILCIVLALMIAFAATAQKNVTQFLGIPVDGTKTAMMQKLKAKGYTYNAKLDCLEGEFNGRNVNISIATNNNKVWRIMVTDAYPTSNETSIKIRFNTLCSQFAKNSKYMPADITGEYEISENEDISTQMSLYNKRYEAAYYQMAEADKDTTGMQEWVFDKILNDYGAEKWGNMSDEERQTAGISMSIDWILEKISKKSVWFMISEQYGSYSINMYYDNEYNHSNGEDL
jgi:hypothetical protein